MATRFKTLNTEELREMSASAFRQIEYLRRREDNGRRGRFALMSDVGALVAQIAEECDLPGGYTDAEDPFAADVVSIVRHELRELTHKQAPYPLPLAPGAGHFEQGRLYNGKVRG